MIEKKYYIYCHKNPITQQIFYIGIGLRGRWKEIKTNRNNHHKNYVSKYGYPIIEKLYENLSQQEACEIEINLIKQYGRIGYDKNGILVNKSSGGELSAKGMVHTQEWKDDHSTKQKQAYINNPQFKDIISKTHKGKIVSQFTRNKISDSLELVKEQRINNLKIGLNKPEVKLDRGKKISEGRKKPIQQFDLEGNFIRDWDSVQDAQNELNIKSIHKSLNKPQYSNGGFRWKSKNIK